MICADAVRCIETLLARKLLGEFGSPVTPDTIFRWRRLLDRSVVAEPEVLDRLRSESDQAVATEVFVPPEVLDAIYDAG